MAAWQQPLSQLYDLLPPNIETVLVRAADGFGAGSPIASKAIDEHLAQLLRRHPEFTVQWLPCGHAIPYFRPAELAQTIFELVQRAEPG